MLMVVGCGGETVQNNEPGGSTEEQKSLLVYSGAGLRKPMDEIGQKFEDEFGVIINYTYAGSAQNLSQLELVQEGDLYMPGALQYIESAEEKGFITVKKNVVYHVPAIGVPQGN